MTPQPKPTSSPTPMRHPALAKAVKALTLAISRRIMDGGEPLTPAELIEILDRELGYTELRTLDNLERSLDKALRKLEQAYRLTAELLIDVRKL